MIIPQKLKSGDHGRVISPSRSLSIIAREHREIALRRYAELGVELSFSDHAEESNDFVSSSIASRTTDLHTAFSDTNISLVTTTIGGFNCNQMLRDIDYDLIAANPKVFCGYSDITVLSNAVFAKTGLVTYSGPHFSTFGMLKGMEWTMDCFRRCVFEDAPITLEPAPQWSDDAWFLDQENRTFIDNEGYWVLQEGEAAGTLIGGNLCTLNLLQGTEWMPSLKDSILLVEDDSESQPHHFDRDLQSLIHQPGFDGVQGMLIGRFQRESTMTRSLLEQIIATKRELRGLPVVANVDFGHTQPLLTLPIGGRLEMQVAGRQASLVLSIH